MGRVFPKTKQPSSWNKIHQEEGYPDRPGNEHLGTFPNQGRWELTEEYNSNEEVHFLEEEAEKEKETEGNNVNSILQILIEGDTEIPSVLYWHKIEANFLAIRRKIQRKAINLKLDLSAIDSKEPQQPSPISNSINFADNEFFKRMGSESDEAFDLR